MESPEEGSVKELPRSDWPVSVSVLGARSVFVVNWCRRAQSPRRSAIPRAGGSGCIRTLGKHQLASEPENCSPVVSASNSCLSFHPDFP